MRNITIQADLFGPAMNRDYSQKALLFLLEALVNINREFLRRNVSAPSLYQSGVKYMREGQSENWQATPVLLKSRFGDCEDLACWRVAEIRNQGGKARPFIRWRRYGSFYLYHVLVEHDGGRMEDPSKLLGMRGAA
jgi:hypothetical protein